MKKHGIGCRILSAVLALVMVLTMVPALQLGAEAADVTTGGHGMGLTANDKITMPIKIMDFETDGMMFDYLYGAASTTLDNPAEYVPETVFWTDFTGTLTKTGLTGNKTNANATSAGGRNVYHGSGMEAVSLATTAGTYSGEKWATITSSSLGGKSLLHVVNNKTNGNPLQWQIANFNGAQDVADVRYAVIVFRAYTCSTLTNPQISISKNLSENKETREADGAYSGPFYLNKSTVNGKDETVNVCGDRHVDVAVIDLNKLTGTVDKLYLEFPMDTTLADVQDEETGEWVRPAGSKFDLISVAFFPNEGDAYQFGHWASSVGAASDTDTFGSSAGSSYAGKTVPVDNYYNHNKGFSFLTNSVSTFGDVKSISHWIGVQEDDDGNLLYGNGERPLFIGGTKNLATDSANGYGGGYSSNINIADAIGYTLFQVIGDTQAAGYATVGLLESSLDENGYPQYKEVVLEYMQIFLRNRLRDCYEYELDGWKNYTTVAGTPNGEIFGYANGGMVDKDPDTPGVQGIPMDFATALCKQLGLKRRTVDRNSGSQNVASAGSYEATMKKRAYLQGSWLDCKQYITTWYDAAYYILHNLWVPNSYNQLESDYNYLNLYKSTNTSSDSYGHYVFDSKLTTVNGSPYTSAVTYNKNTKTIGHSGATYQAYFGSYEAYNPFTPVHHGEGAAGESNSPYYMDDGVNAFSAFGGNLWYDNQNYGYSLVCNGEFTFDYSKELMFHFDGDDDVYLFINGELVMDLGATHNNTASTIELNDYVDWANTVLKNRKNYTLEEVDRAEKLALKDDETYSFDFYYMERHGTGANLRIETNINVVVPELDVTKVASQNGVEVPDNGVVDNTQPVEYGFSLTNDGDTSKLYNISFIDNEIGVELTPENGLYVKYYNLTKNKDGNALQASDLVAYVDGYDGDPDNPRTKKLDTVTVTFADNEELKQFLTNLSSDDGTDTDTSDSLYSGDGLWAHATVTIRGFYYTQTANEQGNASFTNPVTAYAYNGAYKLTGSDTHTVYAFGEPAYFQWAGEDHKIIIDSEKLYEDLKNSKTYKDKDIPQPGHMELTLCDAMGNPMDYEHVSNAPGGDVYLEVHYPDPGLYTVYVNIEDKTGTNPTFTIALVLYVMDVKDSAVVLDYGLTADLSDGNGLFSGDVVNLSGKETLNTVMAITGVTATPSYVEQDVSNEHAQVNTENGITMYEGTQPNAYSGELDTPVYLRHDLPWVIEWKTTGSHSGGLLFSMYQEGYTADNVYIYTRNNSGTSEQDFIAIGRYYNGAFDNHGVDVTAAGYSLNKGQYYRLLNEPFTDGTNRVVLFIGTESEGVVTYERVGVLNTYWINTTKQTTASTFISGKDFTFNYMGTIDGHSINLTNYEYVKVYEQGLEMNNYRWEYNSTSGKVEGVTTEDPGNVLNTNAWNSAGSDKDTDGYYGAVNQRIELSCDKQWVIEYKYSGLDLATSADSVDGNNEEVMLLSSTGTDEHEYLYMRADNGLVCFGTSDSAGYHNYGIAMKEIDPDFDTSAEHVYRIENRIHTDGTSMAYLTVDGEQIGPMNNYFSGGTAVLGKTGNMFTGNNLMFTHIGHKSNHWPVDGILHYLQIWEDTALSGTYGWKVEAGKLVDASVSDVNGNRINFPGDSTYGLIDDAGEIPGEEGTFKFENNKLTFTPSKFMEGGTNTVKVAVTVHDRAFLPTPLEEKTVDIANEVQMYKNISVIPATVVYYEDSFPSLKYVGTANNEFTVIGGSAEDITQNAYHDINYGSDNAYTDSLDEISGDSIHKIKINKTGALASFQFTGTGFELIARTNAVDAASVYLTVYTGDATVSSTGTVTGGTQKTIVPVITQFDNQNNLGAEEVYQVPIIRWESGEAATKYTVVVNGVPSNNYDDAGNITSTKTTWLYIDGLRVYQPLGASHTGYRDVENNAVFTELREHIVSGDFAASTYSDDGVTIGSGLTVFTENLNGEFVGSTVEYATDYLTVGPKNEVYLDGTFTQSALLMLVKEDSAFAVHDLQIAVHAMDYGKFLGAGYTGLGAVLKYSVKNGDVYEWKTLTTLQGLAEQYYTVPYTECPLVDGYYQVALRIVPLEEDIPALAAFTGVKTNGLLFGSYERTPGILDGNIWLQTASAMSMSTAVWSGNESTPGADFESGDVNAGEPSVTPKYPTLSFEDEIKYNIYFTVNNLGSFTTADLGLAIFEGENTDGTVSDAIRIINGAVVSGENYVLRTDGIPAKNLGDRLYFKVYAKLADGSYVYSDLYSYSALDYAREQLRNSTDLEMKQLMVAMLNYGAAAQQYFGYNTDALMNAELLDGDLGLINGYSADMVKALTTVDAAKAGVFGQNVGGFAKKYPSVTFGGAFSINYYFTPANSTDSVTFYYWTQDAFDSVQTLTATNATGKLDMTALGDGSYMTSVNGIAAKNLSDTVFVAAVYEADGVSYCTGILTYSLGAYCAQNAASGSANMQTFASATAVYGYYAENYFTA